MFNVTLEAIGTSGPLPDGTWRPIVNPEYFASLDVNSNKYKEIVQNFPLGISCISFETGKQIVLPAQMFVDILCKKYDTIKVHSDLDR